MKTLVCLLAVALSVLVATGYAQEMGKTEPGKIVREELSVLKATVLAVDQEKRMVTLKDEQGRIEDFKVGKEAVNLPQVKVGDSVTVKFRQSIAVEAVKPGSTATMGKKTTIIRAKPGEMPGGTITQQISSTATVQAIDKKEGSITLMRPDGKSVIVKVIDPANLDRVKVGDELMITYTEAQAISVERAG